MMKRTIARPVSPVFFWLLLMAAEPLSAQERSYAEMRGEVVDLYNQERFEEAADILEGALDVYPDHLMANCVNLALMYVRLEEADKGLKALEHGLENGVWYGKYTFLDPTWDLLKEAPGWVVLETRNEEAKAAAALLVMPRLEVVLPVEYDPEKEYPLFVALHGGGENLDQFMPNWTSSSLNEDFIVAYPQSTQLIAMDGYNWTEDMEVSLTGIREAFEQVVRSYPVDTDRVIVGGFSSGGVASLEVVLRQTIPVRGFVVLCPAMPEGFSLEAVQSAASRGVRGTVLTTEMDGRVDQQRRMADIMEEGGLAHEFHITPDVGHWYPDDLGEKIDRALTHILGEASLS
jgi:predicted esterase